MGAVAGFPTELVREGGAEIEVPAVPRRRGPGARGGVPFYNPAMAINRDVTVALVGALPPAGPFLDGLTATGIAGIRVALEAAAEVVLNDADPQAAELARRNANRNGVAARVEHRGLRSLLAAERFGHVDVDPFGSPVPFVDAAVYSLQAGGRLSLTATDVATLGGLHPRAALRRYDVRLHRTPAVPEVALRVLLGALVRAAARYEIGVTPLFAFAAEHFVRAHVDLRRGVPAADAALARLGWMRFTEDDGFLVSELSADAIGPVWLGPLGDPGIAQSMEDRAPTARAGHLLATVRGELGLPPFYVELNDVARARRVSPPPIRRVLEELEARGFRAARTHFSATGVKSDAPRPDVVRAVLDVIGRRAGR